MLTYSLSVVWLKTDPTVGSPSSQILGMATEPHHTITITYNFRQYMLSDDRALCAIGVPFRQGALRSLYEIQVRRGDVSICWTIDSLRSNRTRFGTQVIHFQFREYKIRRSDGRRSESAGIRVTGTGYSGPGHSRH